MSAGTHGLGAGSNGRGGAGGNGNNALGASSADSNTWWLDIQSPTEDEMKLLGKVQSSVAYIRAKSTVVNNNLFSLLLAC